MVFQKDNRLKVAIFVPKAEVTGATLCREDACSLALREIEAAGLAPKEQMEIEAFENREGWMVFASALLIDAEQMLWFRFASSDDFLDVYHAIATRNLTLAGWNVPGVGFVLSVRGSARQMQSACTYLKEFATPFDAPELLAHHLTEQAIS